MELTRRHILELTGLRLLPPTLAACSDLEPNRLHLFGTAHAHE